MGSFYGHSEEIEAVFNRFNSETAYGVNLDDNSYMFAASLIEKEVSGKIIPERRKKFSIVANGDLTLPAPLFPPLV